VNEVQSRKTRTVELKLRELAIKPGRRVVGDERELVGAWLSELYERGRSIRELTELTGRSYGFVHQVLSERVTLRRRGTPPGGRQPLDERD
jgi:hypothetical protein